jgi:hypothetical protein
MKYFTVEGCLYKASDSVYRAILVQIMVKEPKIDFDKATLIQREDMLEMTTIEPKQAELELLNEIAADKEIPF